MASDTESQPDSSTLKRNQAVWRSRRGLLELDLYLAPFVAHCFSDLPNSLKTRYGQLLELEDVEILDWLKGSTEPPAEFLAIVDRIVAHANRTVDEK